VRDFEPALVVVDPISSFVAAGTQREAGAMLLRLVDFLKLRQATAVFTNLSRAGGVEETDVGISSIIDTWLLLRDIELGGERNRAMYVLKSRGMAHSNQVREFLLTDHGIELKDVYVGPEGVLTGSTRLAQEARERAAAMVRRDEVERRRRDLERKRRALEAQLSAQRAQFEAEEEELQRLIAESETAEDRRQQDRSAMGLSRHADTGEAAGRARRGTTQGNRK
jgi:circadian clock protein KaiC